MVRDRLAELQKNCDFIQKDDDVVIEINSTDNKILTIINEYIEIRDWIADIKVNIDKMKSTVGKISTTFQSSKSKLLLDEMEQIRILNMSICHKIYTKLKDLEINLPFKDDYTILSRIKRTQYYSVREDFLNVWRDNELFLLNYEEKVKKTLLRQAKIVDSNITEEETEELIAKKTTSIFTGNILEDTENARKNLRELLVRQSELEKIERSITEVRDMFLRISTLVTEQSALIQVVEYHAQQASMNVDKGADELEKARTFQVKYLKRKTCILIWAVVILTVLIFLLIVV